MSQVISKDDLNQSIELISVLNLNEVDYERILDHFSTIFKKKLVRKKYKHILKVLEKDIINKEIDFKNLMREIIKIISLNDFNEIITEIVKHKDLIDFIQDLFLEKLI